MAQDFLYTLDKDIYFDESGPVMIDGLDEIKQSINNILTTQLGTWIDEDVGLDYGWLIGGYDENAALSAIQEAIMQDQRVIEILNIDPSYDEKNHRVDFSLQINTTLGSLDFKKEVDVNALN